MKLALLTEKSHTKLPQVLRAAIDLFVENGVHGTTIREIAARAGVSEGALYRHYKSKEDLARSLFVTHLERLTETVETALEEAPSYRAKVRAFVETCLSAYESDPRLFTYLIVSEYRELAALPGGTRHPGHLAMEMIGRGQQAGVLRPMDVHLAGSILVGSLVRVCAAKMYGGWDVDLRTLTAPMSDSIWNALRKD
jgi:AcrR family transcriptional regulator